MDAESTETGGISNMASVDETVRPKALVKAAVQCWRKGLYTDVTLRIGDVKFPAHRLVLASLSDYFPPLFELDETSTGEITLHNMDPQDFSVLLSYGYTGEIVLTNENVQGVATLADYLGVEHVKQQCIAFMASNLNVENVFDVLAFSEIYSFPALKEKTLEFLTRNLIEVSKTPSFPLLHPKSVQEIVSNDDLVLNSDNCVLRSFDAEKVLLQVVLSYFSERRETDLSVIDTVFQAVRLPKIPQNYIQKQLKNFESLRKNQAIQKYVNGRETAVRYIEARKSDNSMTEALYQEAQWLPAAWFRDRKMSSYTVDRGARKYGVGGYEPTPPPKVENENMEIARIDIWLQTYKEQLVVVGLTLWHRNGDRTDEDLVDHDAGCCHGDRDLLSFELDPHELIVSVTLRHQYTILSMMFSTNKGRTFGHNGSGSTRGSIHVEKAPEGELSYLFDINAEALGTMVYNLRFIWITFK